MRTLLDDVRSRTGLDRATIASAVRVAVEVLAPSLDERARQDLLAVVPDAIDAPIPPIERAVPIEELQARIRRELGASRGRAVELAEVIGQAIFARVSHETRARAGALLHPSMRELLAVPPSEAAPAAEESAPRQPGTGRSLATGRPGSAHPVSEAHPGEGRGLSTGRPGSAHPASESRSGSAHPVSEARPDDDARGSGR